MKRGRPNSWAFERDESARLASEAEFRIIQIGDVAGDLRSGPVEPFVSGANHRRGDPGTLKAPFPFRGGARKETCRHTLAQPLLPVITETTPRR